MSTQDTLFNFLDWMEWHDIVVVIVPTLIEMPLQPSSLGVVKQRKVASGYSYS